MPLGVLIVIVRLFDGQVLDLAVLLFQHLRERCSFTPFHDWRFDLEFLQPPQGHFRPAQFVFLEFVGRRNVTVGSTHFGSPFIKGLRFDPPHHQKRNWIVNYLLHDIL